MQELKKEHSGILSRLQEHSFKLNASNTFTSTKPWMLKSDSETYPLLKIYDTNTKFGTFSPLLSPIRLEGDKILDIKKFYEEINVTLMTTLSSMLCLPEYKDHDQHLILRHIWSLQQFTHNTVMLGMHTDNSVEHYFYIFRRVQQYLQLWLQEQHAFYKRIC
jgi:hypothetical protein